MRCSKCGEPVSVNRITARVLHIGSHVTARANGVASFCPQCQAAYCSLHTVWAQPELQLPDELAANPAVSLFLLAHCPDCGSETGGADRRD
jgi:hypothetical protein